MKGLSSDLSGTIWHGWIFRVIIYKRIKVMVMTEKKDIKSYNLDELKQELANMAKSLLEQDKYINGYILKRFSLLMK